MLFPCYRKRHWFFGVVDSNLKKVWLEDSYLAATGARAHGVYEGLLMYRVWACSWCRSNSLRALGITDFYCEEWRERSGGTDINIADGHEYKYKYKYKIYL
jgi:hypothetical protein